MKEIINIVMILGPVALFWWPTHLYFAFLRKNRVHKILVGLSLLSCLLLSVVVIYFSLRWGANNIEAASLGARTHRHGGDPIHVNLMWMPSGLFAIGLFFGFLSGYLKMK